jgi:hypothetical protein
MTGGGWLKLAPGQVTDDTTMCLALGKAILDADGWCMKAVAEAYVAWLRSKPVDCGNTCRRGIRRYMTDGSFAGPAGDGDAGNGAVMRNLPVVLATLHNEAAFEARSLAQARFTHNNALSDAATLICGRLLRRLLLGGRLSEAAPSRTPSLSTTPCSAFNPIPGEPVATWWTPCRQSFISPSLRALLKMPSSAPSIAVTTPTPPPPWLACCMVPSAVPAPCPAPGSIGSTGPSLRPLSNRPTHC